MLSLSRQEMTDAWSERFESLDKGYWISLNSKIRVKSPQDPKTPNKFIEFGGMVEKFVEQINDYCYGRRYLKVPEAKLTCLVAYEIGDSEGLVHCHIIAAHDGSTNRSVSDVERVSRKKWAAIARTDGSIQFVHVADLGSVKDRIWYMTKQTTNHQRLFGETNLSLY